MEVDRTIDITAEEHRTILELLKRHLPGTTAWVYGSRVKWTSRPQSDLDLVVFATSEQAGRVGALREAFEESNLPFRVDLFVWDAVPESFRHEIEAEHVVVTQQEKQYATDGWSEARLGDVIELKRGYDLPKYKRTPGAVPVVSSSGSTDYHMESKVQGPGVVTGRYGTLGRVFFIQRDFWPLNTTLYVRDFKGNDPRFIAYLLQGLDFSAYSDKAAVPGLNRNHLHEEIVRIPTDIDEQRVIAHILGTLDDKIELSRRMNETLEAMAAALFKSWFVDFEPVRAKMEGRDAQLPLHIPGLFPDRLVESVIGMVPRGWEISEIGREVTAVGGTTPSTKVDAFWTDGKHAWATPKDLSALSEPVLLDTAKRVTSAGLATISSGLLPRGTVLMSSRAPIGYLAIAETPVAVNQGFIAMVCGRRLPNIYVLLWCRENVTYIKSIAGGSTFAEISKKAFRPIPVLVPPPDLLDVFTPAVRSLYNQIVANVKQNSCLANIRDLLLPKLISGEFRVQEAEQILDEVV